MTTTSAKKAEVVLGSDNYFHWEFAMRMTLARKGLLAHVQLVKDPSEMTDAWLLNDMKALGLIAQGVAVEHHTKIRSATSAIMAWNTLRDFYNRTTMHNRVTMTRRLHEFKMEGGVTMAKHLDDFDELIVGLQTLGEPLDEARQLVILLSSLPTEYELICSIVENAKDFTLIEVKEKLLKEYERLDKKEGAERALKATANGSKFRCAKTFRGGKGSKAFGSRKNGGFKGKCFNCGQVGHMKRDCPDPNAGNNDDDAVFAVGKSRSAAWLIDSGATAHMTPHRNDLFEYKDLDSDVEVTIADGKKIRVVGTGSVRLTGIDGTRIKMIDVLFIPGLDRQLLSVSRLAERGMIVEFQKKSCTIWNKSKAIALGKKVGKAYMLDCEKDMAHYVEYAGVDSEWELWHARMGHLNKDALAKTQRATTGMPTLDHKSMTICGGCMKGKQTVAHFPSRSLSKTTKVLQLVHTDVMGPMKTKSKGGARYVLTFVDDYSKYIVAYFITKKSEVPVKFKTFMNLYENQWGERIKCLRSDNGTEFVNKEMDRLCALNGIVHQKTVPYSPQQNGVAERMNRTIMEKARSMLYYKGITTMWWAEAVSTSVYLINRSTTSTHSSMTPHELAFRDKPRLDHLRVFGSVGYAHVDKAKRTKLEPKSFKCMFLGYAENSKGYRVYDLESNKVKVTRSLKLDEREVDGIYESTPTESTTDIHSTEDVDEVVQLEQEQQSATQAPVGSVEDNHEEDAAMPEAESDDSMRHGLTTYRTTPGADFSDDLVFHPERERVRRPRDLILALEDEYKVNDEEDPNNDDHFWPPSPKRARVDEDGLLAEAVLAYAASVGDADDAPTTYQQAMKSNEASKWIKAMNSELKAHADNGSWTLVRRTSGARPIGCRWVFAKKRNEHGRVVRYKARLVAKGFKQKFGVDFFETYSPVANMNSIRVVLSVVVAKAYVTEQLDADTAFLNSDLKEQVFMEVPYGILNAEHMMCKLDKAIYGLKQAASAWHQTIHAVFMKIGFHSCGADQCVYVKGTKDNYVYVCLYVDDMIIAAKTNKEIDEVKMALKSAFKMKELGEVKFILGMEIDHDRTASTLMIKQTRYIDDVTSRFNQQDAKAVVNPCESGMKLTKMQSPTTNAEREDMRNKPYRSLIGCLLYITTCTRPDVAYIVTQLSRFLENPGQQHWKAAIRVLRYLKTTKEFGIVYNGNNGKVAMEAYTDADWGSNLDDRRSVSGIMIMVGGAPVIFKSKYQRTVALSSAEAEYMALSLCTQEVLWTRTMLKDLGHEQVGATQVWEDNQGAIALASNAGYNARTKHVDIRHHFIRENVARDIILVGYVGTEDQLADMLTKALGTKRLTFLVKASGICTKLAHH
uniref:Polyprotein n=2 Tax=Phytophthora ramorum TaxID=164328 RepID=H3H572_PHYRM